MNRRSFLSTSGFAILSGTAFSVLQKPTFGLKLDVNQTEKVNLTKTDNILVQFSKFKINPSYIDETKNPATISIQVSLDNINKKEVFEKDIQIQNNNVRNLVEEDIIKNISIPLNTDEKNLVTGHIEITIDGCGISEKYEHNIYISGIVQTSGGNKSDPININGDEYIIHEFTTSNDDEKFSISEDANVDILVVGGGGGGGFYIGGGGGAGGVVHKSITLEQGDYDVTVGSGGSGGSGGVDDYYDPGDPGQDSYFDKDGSYEIRAIGGGGGGSNAHKSGVDGGATDGGSGGGASTNKGSPADGIQPNSSSGGFGNDGGSAYTDSSSIDYSGGGGGAKEQGSDGSSSGSGDGGDGKDFSGIFSNNYGDDGVFGGGGGGTGTFSRTAGGDGGGGYGAYDLRSGGNGMNETGGGGGGGEFKDGGDGGSGVVIIRIGPL